jgi:hypothetical protein
MRDDLDVPGSQPSIELRDCVSQRPTPIRFGYRIANDPHAEFIVLQSRFEIGDQDVEKVFRSFVKMAKMGTPGNVPNCADPGTPQFGWYVCRCHLIGRLLPVTMLPRT